MDSSPQETPSASQLRAFAYRLSGRREYSVFELRQRLLQKGASFATDVKVDEIDTDSVKAHQMHTGELITYKDYDTVVVEADYLPEDRLFHEAKTADMTVHAIGDCVAPRTIEMAVYEGRKIGDVL